MGLGNSTDGKFWILRRSYGEDAVEIGILGEGDPPPEGLVLIGRVGPHYIYSERPGVSTQGSNKGRV